MPRALRASGISKRFGTARALDDVALTLSPGEVHGLLGQNGSGKSTLIKVLAGYHVPEPGGEIVVGGTRVPLPVTPRDAAALGLRFVHQELGLIPSLSVTENLLLEEIATRGRRRISWRVERARAAERLGRRGLAVEPDAQVAGLRPVDRARLAIVRALDRPSPVLILDEPAAFLAEEERRELFAELRELAGSGSSVVITTHDLADVRAAADRVTVLRGGRNAGTAILADVDDERLLEMVIGAPRAPAPGRTVPEPAVASPDLVQGLTGRLVRDVSMDLRRGEVVGLAGPPGSGHDEVPYLLFGARPARGRLRLGSREHDVAALRPDRALRMGIGLVPADRLGQGGVATLPVADNVMLPSLALARAGRRARRRLLVDAERLLARHGVEPADPTLPFGALSGGNQQKAMLAKWLDRRLALLLLDEPLRGVDVETRARLAAMIRAAARDGASVVCASSDAEQLASLCDRVLVFSRGAVTATLTGSDVEGRRIAALCHAGGQAASP